MRQVALVYVYINGKQLHPESSFRLLQHFDIRKVLLLERVSKLLFVILRHVENAEMDFLGIRVRMNAFLVYPR